MPDTAIDQVIILRRTIQMSVHGTTAQAGSGGTPALTGVVSESVKVRGEALVAKVKDLLHEALFSESS